MLASITQLVLAFLLPLLRTSSPSSSSSPTTSSTPTPPQKKRKKKKGKKISAFGWLRGLTKNGNVGGVILEHPPPITSESVQLVTPIACIWIWMCRPFLQLPVLGVNLVIDVSALFLPLCCSFHSLRMDHGIQELEESPYCLFFRKDCRL